MSATIDTPWPVLPGPNGLFNGQTDRALLVSKQARTLNHLAGYRLRNVGGGTVECRVDTVTPVKIGGPGELPPGPHDGASIVRGLIYTSKHTKHLFLSIDFQGSKDATKTGDVYIIATLAKLDNTVLDQGCIWSESGGTLTPSPGFLSFYGLGVAYRSYGLSTVNTGGRLPSPGEVDTGAPPTSQRLLEVPSARRGERVQVILQGYNVRICSWSMWEWPEF